MVRLNWEEACASKLSSDILDLLFWEGLFLPLHLLPTPHHVMVVVLVLKDSECPNDLHNKH